MSQVGIREYDGKKLFAQFAGIQFSSILITNLNQLGTINDTTKRYVVKPDQLFGKRGKHNLVGLNLTAQGVREWITKHFGKTVEIDGISGELDTFLVEEFIDHTKEYYISYMSHRDYDEIIFNTLGGVDIESHSDSSQSLQISVIDSCSPDTIQEYFSLGDSTIAKHIYTLLCFFREYGCTYLEVNPFVIDKNGIIHNLDMVVKVDNCEWFRQKDHRKDMEFVAGFGQTLSDEEKIVADIDMKTGASVKLSILDNDGSIRLILGGGGASVITMDTLHNLNMLHKVGNYGELSGNPSIDDNSKYIDVVIQKMLQSKSDSKVLCIIGGIANFTRIDSMVDGLIRAIEKNKNMFLEQGIKVICRRGGINDKEALKVFEEYCTKNNISLHIGSGDVFLTHPLAILPSYIQ